MTSIRYALAAMGMMFAISGHGAIIDDFKTGSSLLVVNAGGADASTTDVGAAIGGAADRGISVSNTGSGSLSAFNIPSILDGFFVFSAGRTTGELKLSYQLPTPIDLTLGGSTGFEIVDLQIQGLAGSELGLELTIDGQTVTAGPMALNPTGTQEMVTSVAFSLFSGSLSSVNSLEFRFLAKTPGFDVALGEIRTARLMAVPEPGVLMLGLSALLIFTLCKAGRRGHRAFVAPGSV